MSCHVTNVVSGDHVMYHVMCHVTCQVTDHVMKHSTKHIQGTEEQDNKDVKLSLQLATPSVYELPATQA